MKIRKASVLAAIGGVIAAVMLSGCGLTLTPDPEVPHNAPSGGQTLAELHATLKEIPGLTFDEASGSKPNIKGYTGFGYHFVVDQEYRLADPAALVTFLVESAWSVRDGYMPNATIQIRMISVLEDDIDISVAAVTAGWNPEGSETHLGMAENGFSSTSVWVDGVGQLAEQRGGIANLERLGDWPGKVPTLPPNITVPRTE